MNTMDLITYGGIALGIGIVCLVGYCLTHRKCVGRHTEGKQVMGKISEFYGAQDASRGRFEI